MTRSEQMPKTFNFAFGGVTRTTPFLPQRRARTLTRNFFNGLPRRMEDGSIGRMRSITLKQVREVNSYYFNSNRLANILIDRNV